MTKLPSLVGALALGLSVGATAAFAQTTTAPAKDEPAVTTSGTPSAADQQKASLMVENATPNERHLAPHDTFYMLSYVAVKTGTGVEGFTPGQEVHLVEVRRPTHTLVVTDGHAQVEVSPSNLTNDIDMGALARQNDQANQTKLAAYAQHEKAAYDKYERSVADATQKDLEGREKQQQAAVTEQIKEENTPVASTAPPANVPLSSNGYNNNGYYNDGGYGYGNPYSYLINTTAAPATGAKTAPSTGSAAAPAAGHATGGHAAGGHAAEGGHGK